MVNIRKTFLIITLVTLLLSITVISATDIDTGTDIDDITVSAQTELITGESVTGNDNLIQEDNIKTDNSIHENTIKTNNLEKDNIIKNQKSAQTAMTVVPVYPSNFATVFADGGSYSDTKFVFYGQFGFLGTLP